VTQIPVLAGKVALVTGSSSGAGAATTNARKRADTARRMKRMGELVTKLGITGAAKKCEAEGLGKRDANKKCGSAKKAAARKSRDIAC
jgi:NADP-dependent 3-hydroxy acid dehydrogenase YdfG